jgi:hypothetical protein
MLIFLYPWPHNLFFADHVIALSTQSLSSISYVPQISLVLSPTLLSLWMFIRLDLILLPNKTKSHVNLLSSNLPGKLKACVELKQESHAQLSLLVNPYFSCAMSLPWTTPCWLQTLWLPLLLSLFASACSYATNLCHVRFLVGCMFGNGVLIKDRQCHDETESPYGCTHKVVLLDMR